MVVDRNVSLLLATSACIEYVRQYVREKLTLAEFVTVCTSLHRHNRTISSRFDATAIVIRAHAIM